ncbi:GAF domain-containing protein [Falsiroseomonas sp. HW251]|uniref:GAF domain-containing protein n=1 Tax=Falsiroseomonas sp. HW251 TaxID=3390998 RepID=UPI003D310EFA
MSQPTDPIADPKRLVALRRTGLLDSPPEQPFDNITSAASKAMDASVALVSLVADDRQFFKSAQDPSGVFRAEQETTLAMSLCRYAVAARQPLVISDARLSPDFQDHPAVREGGVVAYAGYPIMLADGEAIGTVCVLDTKPREWADDQVSALKDLARQASELITSQADANDSRARLFARKTGIAPPVAEPSADGAATGVVALLNRMETAERVGEPAALATPRDAEQALVAAALYFLKHLDAYVLSLDTPAAGEEEQGRLRAAVIAAQAGLLRALETFRTVGGDAPVGETAMALRDSCAAFLDAEARRTRIGLLFRRGEASMEQVEQSVSDATAAEQLMRLALREHMLNTRPEH